MIRSATPGHGIAEDPPDATGAPTGRAGRLPHSDPLSPPSGHQPRPLKVLIVEDSPIVRERLVALVASVPGVRIVGSVEDGRKGYDLFQQHRPDAVLLDIQLPGINGIELLTRFKREHPASVVMIVTSYDFKELRQRCATLGADYYFHKATEIHRVIEVLSALQSSPEIPSED